MFECLCLWPKQKEKKSQRRRGEQELSDIFFIMHIRVHSRNGSLDEKCISGRVQRRNAFYVA